MEKLLARPKNGLWISIEGVTGVGKTVTVSKLAKEQNIVSIGEVSEVKDLIGLSILTTINELNENYDIFFSKAPAITTFFMLCGMHFNQIEKTVLPSLDAGKIVISDRGLDSPALLQSILFYQNNYDLKNVMETYNFFLKYYEKITFLPDYTIILSEDIRTCIKRVNSREGKEINYHQIEFLERCQTAWKAISNSERVIHVESDNAYELIKSIILKHEKGSSLDN